MEAPDAYLLVGVEAGQTGGGSPVHLHDEEVGQEVGEGEVDGGLAEAGVGVAGEGGESHTIAVREHLAVRTVSVSPGKSSSHHFSGQLTEFGPDDLHNVPELLSS